MLDYDTHSVRSGNYHTLTITTPVAWSSGRSDSYDDLTNKPTINGVLIEGDLTLEDLGIPDFSKLPQQALTNDELEEIIEDRG